MKMSPKKKAVIFVAVLLIVATGCVVFLSYEKKPKYNIPQFDETFYPPFKHAYKAESADISLKWEGRSTAQNIARIRVVATSADGEHTMHISLKIDPYAREHINGTYAVEDGDTHIMFERAVHAEGERVTPYRIHKAFVTKGSVQVRLHSTQTQAQQLSVSARVEAFSARNVSSHNYGGFGGNGRVITEDQEVEDAIIELTVPAVIMCRPAREADTELSSYPADLCGSFLALSPAPRP